MKSFTGSICKVLPTLKQTIPFSSYQLQVEVKILVKGHIFLGMYLLGTYKLIVLELLE